MIVRSCYRFYRTSVALWLPARTRCLCRCTLNPVPFSFPTLQMLDRDLEEAEEQYSLAVRSHMLVVDNLLDLQVGLRGLRGCGLRRTSRGTCRVWGAA